MRGDSFVWDEEEWMPKSFTLSFFFWLKIAQIYGFVLRLYHVFQTKHPPIENAKSISIWYDLAVQYNQWLNNYEWVENNMQIICK